MVPVMPFGPVFPRVGSSVDVGGLVVVVVTTGFVVVVTTGFVVVVVTGALVVVVVGGVAAVGGAGDFCSPAHFDSEGGGDVSAGSHATPTITSANAQISIPAPRRATGAPIHPPAVHRSESEFP